jgi:hypothetical protein
MDIGSRVEIERRAHPTYDRDIIRHCLTGSLISAASISVAALNVILGGWVIYAGFVGMLCGFAFLISKPINACLCPACGTELTREPMSDEFVCASCCIAWTTRGRGESIRDR